MDLNEVELKMLNGFEWIIMNKSRTMVKLLELKG